MLGEGKLMAGFSVVGILLGPYAYGRLQDEAPARDVTRPEAGQEASSPPVVI